VYVGVGRKDGIRPGDLVGAIANETSLSGREIGPIKLAEHFAVVGVPEWSADEVIAALKGTTLKGKKATIRRYTD
jgi:ATP-dependent RNA helicase DeaD